MGCVRKMCVCVMVAMLGGAASAMEKAGLEEPAPNQAFMFEAGSWTLTPIGGALTESFGGNDELLQFGGVDIEYFLRSDVSFITELLAYVPGNTESEGEAFAMSLLLRWYLWQPSDRCAVYAESGVGIFEGSKRFPDEGSHHNYTVTAGFGVRYRLTDRLDFVAAARYLHLSNANLHGEDRNPSFDGFGGYGGIAIQF